MKIKLGIQQPSLPTYRKKIFEVIGLHFDTTIFYGNEGLEPRYPKNIRLIYCKLFKLKFKNLTLKWHSAQLKAVSKEFDCAIITWDVGYISFWLAILKSRLFKIPLIIWGHGYSKYETKLRFFIRNIPLRCVDAVILYDFQTKEKLEKKFNSRTSFFVAPNSLDYRKIQESKNYWLGDNSRLKQFQIENAIDKTYNIIYIGRIYKENHLEILLKAFKEVSLEIKDIKLIIIGKVNDYVNELKSLATRLGLSDKIIWTDAIYDEYKIAPWMLSSKIFCYPENVGLSLIHAFGYGLPAITNDLFDSHGPEIWALIDGVNGLVYQKNNYKNLAQQIIKLYKDEDLRKKLSSKALETVKENYNLDKMVEGFIQAINYALKR